MLTRRDFITRTGALGAALATSGLWLSSCATPTTITSSTALQWELATPYGISFPNTSIWYSGHVNAILELDLPNKPLIVGTDTGGVWRVANDGSAATPLSNDWDVPDINCLLLGPQGPQHIYAGGGLQGLTASGAIYVTDPTVADPLTAWHDISPPGSTRITRLVHVTNPDRIVASSYSGIYWAPIPATGFTYQWHQASGANGECYGLASGSNATVAASLSSNSTQGKNILIVGGWQGSTLVMKPATVSGIDSSSFHTIAVASCATAPQRMYASCSDEGGGFAAVLHSEDGGHSWKPCSMNVLNVPAPLTLHEVATQADGYANCITVAPTNPDTVIVGGFAPCVTHDGGTTWNVLPEGLAFGTSSLFYDGATPMHADQHAITFVPNQPNQVYLGHDGGLTKLVDLQAAVQTPASSLYENIYNRYLATLQFYDPSASHQFWGTLGVSTQVEGLIGGGTQDNGNLYTVIGNPAQPWQRIQKGDGGLMMFTRTGQLINEILAQHGGGVIITNWVGSAFDLNGQFDIPILHNKPGTSTKYVNYLNPSAVELVNDPTYLNAQGKLIYAVAGQGPDLYGLYDVTDVQKANWGYLATTPDQSIITALGAGSGKTVFVGTDSTQVFVFNVATGVFQFSQGLPPADINGYVAKIIVQDEPEAFLILDIRFKEGAIYHTTDGKLWEKLAGGLPNENFHAMDTDWTRHPKPLFVSTDGAIYRSDDNGQTWQNQSSGLPKRPHCGDLRFVLTPKNERYLYLSTYGRSVWRTLVT